MKNHIIHQRLNAQQHATILNRPAPDRFAEWLVGLTEGDGCFSVAKQKNSWILQFKIALHKTDIKTLIYVKKNLQCGKIGWANSERTMIQFCIRDHKHLFKSVFPIFDAYPLITNKGHDYNIIRQIADLLDLEPAQRDEKKIEGLAYELLQLRRQRKKMTKESLIIRLDHTNLKRYCDALGVSMHWAQQHCNQPILKGSDGFNMLCHRASKDVGLSWIIGFFEADGSFYVTQKDPKTGRYCSGFEMSQNTPFVLEVLKRKLRIPSRVKERLPIETKRYFYQLDNTNARVNQYMKKLCSGQFVGLKSLQYRIWSRSLGSESKRLQKIHDLLKKLRA